MRQQNADSELIGRMQAGDGTAVADLAVDATARGSISWLSDT